MTRQFVARGHLIDSGIMTNILNIIVGEGGRYNVTSFTMGKNNEEFSELELELIAETEELLDEITEKLVRIGCYEKAAPEALLKPAPKDGCVPDDFYSTTNHRTEVYLDGEWREVSGQRMDAVIVVTPEGPVCRKIRDVGEGEPVVCNADALRVFPPFRERESDAFGFMSNEVSSERSVDVVVGVIADELKRMKASGEKVIAVAGPVIVHTGGSEAFSALVREGYIHGILAGNALAVHDVENVMLGTSLGVEMKSGRPTHEGHKNHMRAINRIRYHGSLRAAVDDGALTEGVMYEIIRAGIPYCLAGSIRDDGPLPDTVNDMIEAQRQYAEIAEDASLVLMLSSMLHSIGTGNMLPSWVKTVCVDINPAVVTKLSDRGSSQAFGVVSDVGLFLRALAEATLRR